MGSFSPLRLPIIHFSDKNFKSGSSPDDLRRALEEFGCFEAVYDEVSLELDSTIFGLLKDLFNLPWETKCLNISSKPYHGYTGNKPPENCPHEALAIDDATRFEATQDFTNLMWPEGKSSSCEIFHSYAMKVPKLEKMVKKMAMESLGVEKYYESHAETVIYLLRFMKYKGRITDEPQLGMFSRTDQSFFSILHHNQVNGLEVQTKNGEWIRVNPSPSSLIFMVGDAFYAWTNGRVHSPQHRVVMSGNEDRYSIALFSYSSDLVQCPKVLTDEEYPLLFKPFHQMDFLGFYYSTDEGQKDESTLKAYYGV